MCLARVLQNASYEVVAKAMAAIKEADIEPMVSSLSLEQCDILMKYLYRGLAQPGKKTDVYSVRVSLIRGLPRCSLRLGHPALLDVARGLSKPRAQCNTGQPPIN